MLTTITSVKSPVMILRTFRFLTLVELLVVDTFSCDALAGDRSNNSSLDSVIGGTAKATGKRCGIFASLYD